MEQKMPGALGGSYHAVFLFSKPGRTLENRWKGTNHGVLQISRKP